MKSPHKQSGLTYMETMIAVTVISFMVLASVNLISSVYKGITANQMKTLALNMVSENIDALKENGFDSLDVTPDSCLPDPLSNLSASNCPGNPWPVENVLVDSQNFAVYKVVQYAVEDINGNLIPKLQSDMTSGISRTLKQITVTVCYYSNNVTKTTSTVSYLTNKEVPMSGSSLSGIVQVSPASGSAYGPGLGSNATVYFVGYPQYTSHIIDNAGNYSVSNIMPGSYTLYAEGIGFARTYYASNPVVVPNIATPISGVNFACSAVVGSSVSGHIYIGVPLTPSVTLTPTPTVPATFTPTYDCPLVKSLPATGAMTGKTQDWTHPTYVVQDDTNYASNKGNGDRLYTEFGNYTQSGTYICKVILNASVITDVCGDLNVSFVNNTSNAWAPTTSGPLWNGTVNSTIVNLPLTTSWTTVSKDITSIYNVWDWNKVNGLGACFTTNDMTYYVWIFGFDSTVQMDVTWLDVYYSVIPPSPTNTPTYTMSPTPNATFTPTPWCANGAQVIASDGLSLPYSVTSCDYTISNINPLLGATDISATLIIGTHTYYASATNVAVSPGTTTSNINLLLQEITGVPSITGFVKDKQTSVGLSGIDVYLGTTKVATTGGGGAYTVFPVSPGTWLLDAKAPGYLIETKFTYPFTATSGLRQADTLYMLPVGAVSGLVTDYVTGNPVAGQSIEVRDSTDAVIATGYTDNSGIFLINNISAGTAYKVKVVADGTIIKSMSPASGYYNPTAVVKGVTTLNLNFRIMTAYHHIKGKVQVDGIDADNGVMVIALPSSVTITPGTFSLDNAAYLKYNGRNKILYQSYGLISQRNANFDIPAPVYVTYTVYAYYSYVSYTGSVTSPVKTLKKYYKRLSNIYLSTSDIDNQNITGSLSGWTAY